MAVIINAEDLVLGKIASFAAKKALQGEQVTVVNAEKSIITGRKETNLKRFKTRLDLQRKGNPHRGPKASRMPDRMLRYAVRGMLPFKSKRGREAFRRVKVFIGVPKEMQESKKDFSTIEKAKADKEKSFVCLGELCKLLGARW